MSFNQIIFTKIYIKYTNWIINTPHLFMFNTNLDDLNEEEEDSLWFTYWINEVNRK